MSAPTYNPSIDATSATGTAVNGNGKTRAENEEDLHRYVTDDMPRPNKMTSKGLDTGLIVSFRSWFLLFFLIAIGSRRKW